MTSTEHTTIRPTSTITIGLDLFTNTVGRHIGTMLVDKLGADIAETLASDISDVIGNALTMACLPAGCPSNAVIS